MVLTTAPPCAARPRRAGCASWRASAGRIASGCCSQRRVEPSRSVNRNVTVPDGSSGTSPPRPVADARMIARRGRVPVAESGARPSGGTPYPRRHAERTRPGDRARARAARAGRRPRDHAAAAPRRPTATAKGGRRAGEQVTSPTKLIRIASMVRTMLDEVRRAPLDDAGRRRAARDPREVARTSSRASSRPSCSRSSSEVVLPFTSDDAERVGAAHRAGAARRLARRPLPRHPGHAVHAAGDGPAAARARCAAGARSSPARRRPSGRPSGYL